MFRLIYRTNTWLLQHVDLQETDGLPSSKNDFSLVGPICNSSTHWIWAVVGEFVLLPSTESSVFSLATSHWAITQKNLTRCREVIFTAVVGWIFWSWQERFASGGQDGLVSVMTPAVRAGKVLCLLHDIIYVWPRTQRSTSFFGWLTGSILWVKTSKISVSYWSFRYSKYLSPISVQEVSGARHRPIQACQEVFWSIL